MSDITTSALLPRREVVYCEACGMPPEYCEYCPDFETHCDPWLKQNHPEMRAELAAKRSTKKEKPPSAVEDASDGDQDAKPKRPWTVEERLTAFYEKYVPEKVDNVPSLLEKYAGKEEKLFAALVKKYGPEPEDPYDYSDDNEGDEEEDAPIDDTKKNKRRGAGAKKGNAGPEMRVVIQSVAQKKRKKQTIIKGMETVPSIKLKEVAKAFSKRFAGSSSVKDNVATGGKDVIIQGDHMYDVAEMIIGKFGVHESAIYLEIDKDIVPLRG